MILYILLAPCYIFAYYDRSIWPGRSVFSKSSSDTKSALNNRIYYVLDEIKKSGMGIIYVTEFEERKKTNNVKDVWRRYYFAAEFEKSTSSITKDTKGTTSKYMYRTRGRLRERGSYLLRFFF